MPYQQHTDVDRMCKLSWEHFYDGGGLFALFRLQVGLIASDCASRNEVKLATEKGYCFSAAENQIGISVVVRRIKKSIS